MSAATTTLPHVLSLTLNRRAPIDLDRLNTTDLRKVARVWLDSTQRKLARDDLVKAFHQALNDDAVAARIARSLSTPERRVLAAYRRLGDTADGEVIRLDLMSRGLLEVIEKRYSDHYTSKEWKQNPVMALADKWILLPDHHLHNYYSPYRVGRDPDQPFDRYTLHAGVAKYVDPAGPPAWSIPRAASTPQTQTVMRRSPAEVALDLSRIVAFVAGRRSIKVRKDGCLAGPTLRAMEKALPVDDGPEYRLPEPHALYVELLRYGGIIQVEGNEAHVDPAAATHRFAQSGAWQAHAWACGWLRTRYWFDGSGTPETYELEQTAGRVVTCRQVLAWALGCLARAGDHWYDLKAFLSGLHTFQGSTSIYLSLGTLAWDPKLLTPKEEETQSGAVRQRTSWFAREGAWYANAVMVTLVALGLVERGRIGPGASAPHGFRLTELGRAVFGAPEVAPPPESEPGERRFLLIQPNFDVVAYLDRADASAVGILGRLAESDSARTGPIQTFRLTQSSLYQAQESGLDHTLIVDFLRQHSQREPPANVLQAIADWAGKRESLILRSGVTVVGFPSPAERDAYLERHPGTALGVRFVLMPSRDKDRPKIPGALVSDHLTEDRRTLELDEHGRIDTKEPMDLVQMSRLRRLARPAPTGWQITSDSIRQAAASGIKPGLIDRWLRDHLARPMPPLIALAIDAWLGMGRSLEIGDALLLHVPDDATFQAIVTSRRLRPLLLGSPGPHWLAVRREARKDLAAVLEELGFTLDRNLTQGGLPAIDKREGSNSAADGADQEFKI